jgi:hypothetical protein
MDIAVIMTYAEVLEIGLKSVALILAGAWAVFGFIVFRQRATATTALRKVQAEVADLELSAKRRAVLDISINHEVFSQRGEGVLIGLEVVITNSGVGPAYLQFSESEPTICLWRVEVGTDGSQSYAEPLMRLHVPRASSPATAARARVVRAGGVTRIPTIARVSQGGVYLATFRVPMDGSNRESMLEAGASKERKHTWSGMAFIVVGSTPAGQPVSEVVESGTT